MPTFTRRQLRQDLGKDFLHDVLVGTTTHSCGYAGSGYIMDSTQANATFSGDSLFERAWAKVNGFEYRIGSFNTASGAFCIATPVQSTIMVGTEYEIHERLSPTDKDRMLDRVIGNVYERKEVPMWSTGNQQFYPIETAVGHDSVVFNAWYYSDPTSSLNRNRHDFDHWAISTTGSGRELRISPTLQASEQIVLDAMVSATLGAADTATVALPQEDWVLSGVAGWCFELLARRSPGQEADGYRKEAARWSRAWTLGHAAYRPQIESKVQLDTNW